MRGLTKEALAKIDLRSQGWEYASEIGLEAARLKMPISEVPVKFYKDREGRMSHHRRAGWLSPWIAGWLNLKVMLVYSRDTFFARSRVYLVLFGTPSRGSTWRSRPVFFSRYWFRTALDALGFISQPSGTA